MKKEINKYALRYAEKTSQHLFVVKHGEKIHNYFVVRVAELNSEKVLIKILLDKNFKLTDFKIDNLSLYQYPNITDDGYHKHYVDSDLKYSIFNHYACKVEAVKQNFNVKIGEEPYEIEKHISSYLYSIQEQILKSGIIEKRLEEIDEKIKAGVMYYNIPGCNVRYCMNTNPVTDWCYRIGFDTKFFKELDNKWINLFV
jgi:hypothetical protein